MPYMLLIVEPPDQRAERSPEAARDAYAQMEAFGAGLKKRGLLISGESLTSTADGARLQMRGEGRRLVDGPFAEAKEMIGGFFVVDCESLEEASAIAADCPAAQWCTIEIRKLGPCWA